MVAKVFLGGIAGSLVAAGLATATFAAGPPAPPAANATAGQTLYQQNCAACHGPDAKGGLKLGDATAADLRWQTLGPTYHNNTALVQRAILQGLDQDGQPLDTVMPRWQGTLTTTQAQDLIAYLQTLTTAVPGQVVATPVHEEATPEPTEEAQEAAQAATAVAKGKTSTTSTAAAAAAGAAQLPAAQTAATSTAIAPAAVPATGGGGGAGTGGILLAALGVLGLVGSAIFGVARRRT